jgi:hypothetical protein
MLADKAEEVIKVVINHAPESGEIARVQKQNFSPAEI